MFFNSIISIGGRKMKSKKNFRSFISKWYILLIIIIASALITEVVTLTIKSNFNCKEPVSTYKCDVKHFFKLKTTINVDSENQDGIITGNFAFGLLKKVHDPLVFCDLDGNTIAKSSDVYHFFTQDDHTIFDENGNVLIVMEGQFQMLGEKYLIYDGSGTYIGYLSVGITDTYGGYYDTNGILCATYKSHVMFKDYDLVIDKKATLPDEAIVMMFASYYSDHAADSTGGSGGSSHSSK